VAFVLAALGGALAVGALLMLLSQRSRHVERLLGETAAAKDVAETANRQLLLQMEERERAEAALRQAQRMEAIGQLTGGVAHDFNNLLTVVLGNIDLLELTGALDRESLERLTTMRAAAERGAALTVQLLAFARRQPLVPRDIDLNAVVSEMNDLLQSALGSRVRIETRLDRALWHGMVDPTQIELVILNLAINARDAMSGGGTLTISTGNVQLGASERDDAPPPGDYVMISVSDTGSGMTPEVLAKAFEPFFTTKPTGAGSGLGLSQVFGLARQSGGGVAIESQPGLGTTVRVYLPRAPLDAKGAGGSAPSVAPPRASLAVVMVVDDDQAVRSTVSQILSKLGYTVEQAESGEVALAAISAGRRIDLLLTDLAMPDMAGSEVARRARELRPSLPVVFISGYADPEAIVGDGRASRLVRKPFRPTDLATQIEAALLEAVGVA
jgi:signal transduction histidine kinase